MWYSTSPKAITAQRSHAEIGNGLEKYVSSSKHQDDFTPWWKICRLISQQSLWHSAYRHAKIHRRIQLHSFTGLKDWSKGRWNHSGFFFFSLCGNWTGSYKTVHLWGFVRHKGAKGLHGQRCDATGMLAALCNTNCSMCLLSLLLDGKNWVENRVSSEVT